MGGALQTKQDLRYQRHGRFVMTSSWLASITTRRCRLPTLPHSRMYTLAGEQQLSQTLEQTESYWHTSLMPEGEVVQNVTEDQHYITVALGKDEGFIAWPSQIVSSKRVRYVASTGSVPLGVVHMRKNEVIGFHAQTCFAHVEEFTLKRLFDEYGLDEASFNSVQKITWLRHMRWRWRL